ncbi:hypothetical protein [Deinococcus sp.]|uniref:hypothetical protein n=1 Tax=Deinococcus sp. TaxID=47478 RepID=UPI003B58C8AA
MRKGKRRRKFSFFSKFALFLSLAAQVGLTSSLAADENPLALCNKTILPKVQVVCDRENVTIKTPSYSKSQALDGELSSVKFIPDNYLQVEIVTSGALTSSRIILVDLRDGKAQFYLSATDLYSDEQYIVYRYTGYSGFQEAESPLIYVFKKDNSQIEKLDFTLSPRPNCEIPGTGLDEVKDDMTVTKFSLIFHRRDQCGEFDIIKSWRR